MLTLSTVVLYCHSAHRAAGTETSRHQGTSKKREAVEVVGRLLRAGGAQICAPHYSS